DVGDPDRRDHRRRSASVAQRAQRDALDRHPEDAGRQHRHDKGEDEGADQRETAQYRALAGYPEQFKRPHADKRADHEHVEMREIDQLEDAIDEREAERQQGVHRAETQPIDDLLQQNRVDDHAAWTLIIRSTETNCPTGLDASDRGSRRRPGSIRQPLLPRAAWAPAFAGTYSAACFSRALWCDAHELVLMQHVIQRVFVILVDLVDADHLARDVAVFVEADLAL